MLRSAVLLSLVALTGCATRYSAPVAPATAPSVPPDPAFVPPAAPEAQSTVPAEEVAYEGTAQVDDDVDEEQEAAGASLPSSLRSARTSKPADPLLALNTQALEGSYRQDPTSVGSLSIGRAGAGKLVNGVPMTANPQWTLTDPGRAYGTRETVDALTHCIGKVNQQFSDTQPVVIGHLSAKNGGHLSPHVSHQSGRDADVGYYYRHTAPQGFIRATPGNLDLPRTWALIRCALVETDIEMVLVDSSLQRPLADYAVASGEDKAFVEEVFQVRGKNAAAPIRHIKGHATHVHFRFHSPVAEELARRLAHVLPKPPPVVVARSTVVEAASSTTTPIRARNGDTLVILAKRYGTTVEELQRLNGLRSNAIRAGAVYKVPQKTPPKPAPRAVTPPAHKGGKTTKAK